MIIFYRSSIALQKVTFYLTSDNEAKSICAVYLANALLIPNIVPPIFMSTFLIMKTRSGADIPEEKGIYGVLAAIMEVSYYFGVAINSAFSVFFIFFVTPAAVRCAERNWEDKVSADMETRILWKTKFIRTRCGSCIFLVGLLTLVVGIIIAAFILIVSYCAGRSFIFGRC